MSSRHRICSKGSGSSSSKCRRRRRRIELVQIPERPTITTANFILAMIMTERKRTGQQQRLEVAASCKRQTAALARIFYWWFSSLVILTLINKSSAFSTTTQIRIRSSSSSTSAQQQPQQQHHHHRCSTITQLYGTSKDDDDEDVDLGDDEEEDEGMKEKKGLGRAEDDDDELQKKIEEQQKQIDLLLSMMKAQQQQQQSEQEESPSPSSRNVQSSSQQQPQQHQSRSLKPTTSAPTSPSSPSPFVTTASMNPLKAMLFIDGTWLYYTLHERADQGCRIIKKFGRGWQRYYYFDWLALPRVICSSLLQQDLGWTSSSSSSSSVDQQSSIQKRPVEIVRANVFTSYKADTRTDSLRFQMFQDMSNANYDVHMFTTIGKNEKCVDINIAVEMLHYATVPNAYDVALLLTGDKDFIPAMIRTRQKGKRVGLISFHNGCNKALSEVPTDSNNNNKHQHQTLRDYDVVWIDDHLDELIKPYNDNNNQNNNRIGGGVQNKMMVQGEGNYNEPVSAFTFMKVLSDFITKSNLPRVNSRDVGKYLKDLQIGNGRRQSLLDELKIAYVGLNQFIATSRCFFIESKNSRESVAAGHDNSYWIGLKGDADLYLMKEAKSAKLSPAEKKFFDDYSLDDLEYHREDVYYFSLYILRQVDPRFESDNPINPNNPVPRQLGDQRFQSLASDHSRNPSPMTSSSSSSSQLDNIPGREESPDIQLPEMLTRDYSQLTVPKLKDYCRENDLKVSGTKSELLERIQDHVNKEIEKFQDKNGATATATATATKHETTTSQVEQIGYLENLVLEYIHARGGQANSRDVGHYLKANRASPERLAHSNGQRVSALTELKEKYGSMNNLVVKRPSLFTKREIDRQSSAEDDYGFYVVSRQRLPSRTL